MTRHPVPSTRVSTVACALAAIAGAAGVLSLAIEGPADVRARGAARSAAAPPRVAEPAPALPLAPAALPAPDDDLAPAVAAAAEDVDALWQGFVGGVDDLLDLIEERRPDLASRVAQPLVAGADGFETASERRHEPPAVTGRLGLAFEDGLDVAWRGHTMAVRPLFGRGPGRLVGDAVVYDLGADVDVVTVALADRLEELVLVRTRGAVPTLEYVLEPGPTITEVRPTALGTVELWSRDACVLRLNPVEALDADRERIPGAWTVVPRGDGTYLLRAEVDLALASFPVAIDPGWSSTQTMVQPRQSHAAVSLASGDVVVLGGRPVNGAQPLTSIERFDVASLTWSAGGALREARVDHTATLLADGTILVVGGTGRSAAWLATCERHDPAARTSSAAASLVQGRSGHTATRIPSGQVVVIGGQISAGDVTPRTELFNPVDGRWTSGAPGTPRTLHAATLLSSGDILVFGGHRLSWSGPVPVYSASRYSPGDDRWSDITVPPTLSTGLSEATALTLPTGEVFIVGGQGPSGWGADRTLLLDGDRWSQSPLGMRVARCAAAVLPSGQVFLLRGETNRAMLLNPKASAPLASAQEFDAPAGARLNHLMRVNVLPGGRVLVSGPTSHVFATTQASPPPTSSSPAAPTGPVERYRIDFEQGAPGWTFNGTSSAVRWRTEGNPIRGHGSSACLGYNDGRTYDDRRRNSGTATSPWIDLAGLSRPRLVFQCNYETEGTGTGYDTRHVLVSTSNFSTTRLSQQLSGRADSCGSMNAWHEHALDLDPSWGQVQVRFSFDTVDASNNQHRGWFVDDLRVVGQVAAAASPTGRYFRDDFRELTAWTVETLGDGRSGARWSADAMPASVAGGPFRSAPSSLNFNNGRDYDPGRAAGQVTSPRIVLPSSRRQPRLVFWCNYDTETTGRDHDQRWVRLSRDGFRSGPGVGHQLSTTHGGCGPRGGWHRHELPIDPTWPEVTVRFHFDSMDAQANRHAGWFVDDLEVTE